MASLTFALHREFAGNEYLALYDLLQLPAANGRVGFVEVPLRDLEGQSYVSWAAEVVDGADDSIWDVDRLRAELERLHRTDSMLTPEESLNLRTTLLELLPAIEPARCWLQIRAS